MTNPSPLAQLPFPPPAATHARNSWQKWTKGLSYIFLMIYFQFKRDFVLEILRTSQSSHSAPRQLLLLRLQFSGWCANMQIKFIALSLALARVATNPFA